MIAFSPILSYRLPSAIAAGAYFLKLESGGILKFIKIASE
jgi:hypothetical protein